MKRKIALVTTTIALALVAEHLINRENSYVSIKLYSYLGVRPLRDFLTDYSLNGQRALGVSDTEDDVDELAVDWPANITECPNEKSTFYQEQVMRSRPCTLRVNESDQKGNPAFMEKFFKFI